jgi:succinyl-CoA synthetase beta subunit
VKLREYQAKAVFADRGIRVPRGEIVTSAATAADVARTLGGATVLKPQLGVKGRGKVGAIAFAETPEEAAEQAERLIGSNVKGETVETILVEERIDLQREYYLAVAVDYAARRPIIMASLHGGVDIEAVARDTPEELLRIPVSMLTPPDNEDLAPVRDLLGDEAAEVLLKLYGVFRDFEAEAVEINPIVTTPEGLVAVDAVLNVNDSGLFRHPDLLAMRAEIPPEDPLAEEAHQKDWTYIHLGGDVGILSSGAGLTMTIVDLLARAGSSAANFLDTAQINEEGIYEAFELLQRAPKPKVWLVNIFAGLNRCDLLADGIRRYLTEHPVKEPVVVRMVGNLEKEGHAILREVGIEPVRELEDAIERCVALAKTGGVA